MNQLDKKTFAIGVLCLSALVLVVAHLMVPRTATANEAVKEGEYQAVTAQVPGYGEALYLTDLRSGVVGVFVYDVNRRQVVPLVVRPVQTLFGGAGGLPGKPGVRPPGR